jgi:N-acetylmuramic acid 6-phosphate etherase
VSGAINKCRENGISTACVTCNPSGKLAQLVDFPLVAPIGPELVTGSTRLKSGTAQKLILNMISTSVMIKLGRVKGNKMVDMQLSNSKLIDRGTRMVMDELHVEYEEANKLLLKYGSVRGVLTEMGK